MLSDWNAECSTDSPTLVVPWSSASDEAPAHFVDLRSNPYDIAEIPEADRFPALGRALRSLNATRSPFLTAKCDAWTLNIFDDEDQLEALRLELMLSPEDAAHGFASYIDLLWRERSVFASPHQQQVRLDRIIRRAARLPHSEAALECTLRPALLDLNSPLEGFAITLYVTAVGVEPEIAYRRWELALDDVVTLLRSKELEIARGSATIDAVDANP
ncbi:MAG: hypothetical protein V4555_20680 [Acidobacteriota bacterium]